MVRVTTNAGISRFSVILQADTIIFNTITSEGYYLERAISCGNCTRTSDQIMNNHPISVTWQGSLSRDLLKNSQKAVITGLTSRGIFIKLDTGWILFLSFEGFRGPLTLNLSGETSILNNPPAGSESAGGSHGLLNGIKVSDPLEIQDGKIQNLPAGIEIDFSRAGTWEAPPQLEILLSPGDRARSLKTVAGLILSQNREPGLYLVLKELLGLEIRDLQSPPKAFERVDYVRLLQLLKTTDLDGILSTLRPLLGLGAGLTPAGDDLILGLLLAYNRWGPALRPVFDLAELDDRLNRAASQKTTLLSANLIACASQGQADERLVNALDGMITGNPAPDQCARSLSSWGNSSGCDALVGMALAILSSQP